MKEDLVGEIIGVLGILIGFVVSYYFYYRSKREKSPCWAIKSNNLISGFESELPDLQVLFKAKNLKNLTISKILLWNDGNETISSQDLETINPLRIISKDDAEILDVKVLQINNKSSQITTKVDENNNQIKINFDYLDKNQGAVFQVIHTGLSSNDLCIVGDIKGVLSFNKKGDYPNWIKLISKKNPSKKDSIKKTSKFGIISGFIYILLGILNYFFYPLIPKSNIFVTDMDKQVNLIIISTFFILTGLFMFYTGFILSRNENIAPKGLESFNEK